jgi:hypothetical protein
MIGIDRTLTGLDKHLFIDGGKTSLLDERPVSSDWVGLEQDHADLGCVLTLLELEGRTLDTTAPARFDKVSELLGKRDPWALVHPSRRLWWGIDKLKEASALVDSGDRSYHRDVFVPSTEIFKRLTPWRVNPSIVDTDDPMAASCWFEDGWAAPPTYNRFGTRTGRLTVVGGPRVLTVRQATRERFVAVDVDHLMVSFDFSSLEARVALGLAGKEVPVDVDPYVAIAKLMKVDDRDAAKSATFAALYSDPTDASQRDPRVSTVRRIFKLGEAFARLKRSMDTGVAVRNLYGRVIPEATEATLYNNYVQSTGCDVTLLGFCQLERGLSLLGVKPHFLLHDALFASVPVKCLKEAACLASLGVNVPNFKLPFPIKASTTSGRPIV